MANSEPLYDCSDCGIKGEDRNPKEINYFYPTKTRTGTVWHNRCSACYYKHLAEQKKSECTSK